MLVLNVLMKTRIYAAPTVKGLRVKVQCVSQINVFVGNLGKEELQGLIIKMTNTNAVPV